MVNNQRQVNLKQIHFNIYLHREKKIENYINFKDLIYKIQSKILKTTA